ncbi:hypothetical protein [Aquabacterium sp. CECT 9606]|jgi:hypothetical protein|uniref:hypothetical protein n=1 Tax=Aquabacterium sp. CECT 9606 TaxID=2845822 RepID=UPI001E49CAD0|nr:hypothetical protein [Aquabacterium sp. CECT 9606]
MGVPTRYITNAKGPTPYKKKVTIAPSTLPMGLTASATVINRTTNIQAIAMIHISGRGLCQAVRGPKFALNEAKTHHAEGRC